MTEVDAANDVDAMAHILRNGRDLLRSDHNWPKGNCRLSFETTPITNGAPWFVGMEEIGVDNEAGEEDSHNAYEHSIRVGLWRDCSITPNDREGMWMEEDDVYMRDRLMLYDLEKCVRRTLQSYALLTCVNDSIANDLRPTCYPPVLSQLRFQGRSETRIVTDIPSINVRGGKWVRRLLTFRGMKQIVQRS